MSKKNGNSKKVGKSYRVIVLLFFTIFLFIPLIIGIKIKFDEIKGNTKSVKESSQISRSVDTDNKETGINLLDKNELENLTNHAKYSRDQNGLYELTGPVIDVANLLSQFQYEELDNFLRDLDSSTGAQIAVLTVKSMNGESIERFSIRHAEKWKLGQEDVDNGALLTVAMDEHEMRIETGYGTEGALTDAKCSQIINKILIPKFRDNKYGEGIVEAVKNMAGIITSDESLISEKITRSSSVEPEEEKSFWDNYKGAFYVIISFALFILFVCIADKFIGSKNGGKGSSYSSRRFYSSSSSRSSSSRSYSSGRSYSGGGGHFGGGGASGRW